MVESSTSPPGLLAEAISKADPLSKVRDGRIPGPAGTAHISHGHEDEIGWPEHLLGPRETGGTETAHRPD